MNGQLTLMNNYRFNKSLRGTWWNNSGWRGWRSLAAANPVLHIFGQFDFDWSCAFNAISEIPIVEIACLWPIQWHESGRLGQSCNIGKPSNCSNCTWVHWLNLLLVCCGCHTFYAQITPIPLRRFRICTFPLFAHRTCEYVLSEQVTLQLQSVWWSGYVYGLCHCR